MPRRWMAGRIQTRAHMKDGHGWLLLLGFPGPCSFACKQRNRREDVRDNWRRCHLVWNLTAIRRQVNDLAVRRRHVGRVVVVGSYYHWLIAWKQRQRKPATATTGKRTTVRDYLLSNHFASVKKTGTPRNTRWDTLLVGIALHVGL